MIAQSMRAGVVGYMALWDISLDPVSMITIIMSIGFAIDFSAHITYGCADRINR